MHQHIIHHRLERHARVTHRARRNLARPHKRRTHARIRQTTEGCHNREKSLPAQEPRCTLQKAANLPALVAASPCPASRARARRGYDRAADILGRPLRCWPTRRGSTRCSFGVSEYTNLTSSAAGLGSVNRDTTMLTMISATNPTVAARNAVPWPGKVKTHKDSGRNEALKFCVRSCYICHEVLLRL